MLVILSERARIPPIKLPYKPIEREFRRKQGTPNEILNHSLKLYELFRLTENTTL